jgi:putative sigma-54 modulation protein
MQLTVTGRHIVVSDALRQQIERKLSRLGRLLNDSAVSAQCVLARERNQAVCELSVHARGDHTLVGVGRHARMPGAIAAAVDKVTQQAQRLADRWKKRRKRAPGREADAAAGAEVTDGEPTLRVIRARGYTINSLTVDDAVLALSRGNASFLVFRRASSDSLAVVFRRPDGHFGLIDTAE